MCSNQFIDGKKMKFGDGDATSGKIYNICPLFFGFYTPLPLSLSLRQPKSLSLSLSVISSILFLSSLLSPFPFHLLLFIHFNHFIPQKSSHSENSINFLNMPKKNFPKVSQLQKPKVSNWIN